MPAPLPFTVVGGFLGAGKTTLLNRLLAAPGGVRYAVLVNDFGSLAVDGDLVRAHGGDTIALANGCICCSLADGLSEALMGVAERADAVDHVVVEASGVADPARLADVAVLDPAFVPDGVVVMVDAGGLAHQLRDRYLADTVRRQLAAADLLVLNKTDLADAPTLDAARRSLADLAPAAALVHAVQADVPLPLAFARPDDSTGGPGGSNGPGGSGNPGVHGSTDGTDNPAPPSPPHPEHDAAFRAATVTFPSPPERSAFLDAAASLPPSVVRAKGWIRFADAPATLFLFQKAGRRHTLEPARRPPAAPDAASAPPPEALVLIGTPAMPPPATLATHLGGTPESLAAP